MKTSTKILVAVSGILLIILGVLCIANPGATLLSSAWIVGLLILISGISMCAFYGRARRILPFSGSLLLSGICQILIGLIFLSHNLVVAAMLPYIFAFWVIFEGIKIAVNSFDFKRAGYPQWWALLLLGICTAILGCAALSRPEAAAETLALLIGIGLIAVGIEYLVALSGINRFEKKVKDFIGQ